jgi:D-methionine transport system ATP-binding protein
MIELDHVTKVYHQKNANVVALDDVSLTIAKGEIFGIIGLSGAGKSTLIRVINRLETPQSGSVRIQGADITALNGSGLRKARQKIGMIFQHFNLLNSRTVFGNIAFPLEIAGVKPAAVAARVKELAELVGLSSKLDAHPSQLSGGQKQRVGIARALANRPEILLCDEATSALDPQTTKSILKLLQELNQNFGITIVLITHEIQVIKEICDSVAVIEDGHIVESGPILKLFTQPDTEIARRFIGAALNRDVTLDANYLSAVPRGECRRLIRIDFIGETARSPIIASVIGRFEVEVNILHAHMDSIKETPFGSLIVEMAGTAAKIEAALQYLTELGIRIEVLPDVGSATVEPAH